MLKPLCFSRPSDESRWDCQFHFQGLVGSEGVCRRWGRHALGRSLERNMRSKIRWFTEFCNSHYVSHFAAFFIVARAKISVVESCLRLRDRRSQSHHFRGTRLGVWLERGRDPALRDGRLDRKTERSQVSAESASALRLPLQSSPALNGERQAPAMVRECCWSDSMILPQVHLRKPCYDFSFL